jgi:hypothetical protein
MKITCETKVSLSLALGLCIDWITYCYLDDSSMTEVMKNLLMKLVSYKAGERERERERERVLC